MNIMRVDIKFVDATCVDIKVCGRYVMGCNVMGRFVLGRNVVQDAFYAPQDKNAI